MVIVGLASAAAGAAAATSATGSAAFLRRVCMRRVPFDGGTAGEYLSALRRRCDEAVSKWGKSGRLRAQAVAEAVVGVDEPILRRSRRELPAHLLDPHV